MGLSKKKFNIFGIRFVGGRVHEKLINRRELPKKVIRGGGERVGVYSLQI